MRTRVLITTKENERTMTSDDQELTLRVVPTPGDINTNGHIFGGRVLSQMDIAGGLIASLEEAGAVATVAIETMTFIAPSSEERRSGKECVCSCRSLSSSSI